MWPDLGKLKLRDWVSFFGGWGGAQLLFYYSIGNEWP